ncbi:phage tail assembly protein [Pseudomonas marginalis]|uniref:phage tail assembly protein n=1 Tax=Pseudomonas marginalis TaxID=298 RepID=UPI0005FB3084|nr:phage tail assembly protein [Pseudomonas marginalis]KJZ51991.1 tail fiber protein [Pseudomonas marginalis]KJZ59424.1 tail fiber protein [Pseudomonas marginalis]
MKTAATEQPDVKPLADDNTVILDTPIRRGPTSIDSITLRKPNSGELRGVSLADLLQMDVNSLIKVVPRISAPSLTAIEVTSMDPADLVALSTKITGFLLQKSAKTDASLVA